MNTYTIHYIYQGEGTVTVQANNEEDAKNMFYDGECEYNDRGYDYEVDTVTKEKKI